MSKAPKLHGSMERLILEGVAELGDGAYGAALQRYAISRLGKKPAHGQVHRAVRRLEVKGFLTSRLSTIETTLGRRGTRAVCLSEIGQKMQAELLKEGCHANS